LALGYGSGEPINGSIAANIQSKQGDVKEGVVFAHVQSVAIGGYGSKLIDTVTRLGALFVGVATFFSTTNKRKKD